MSIATSYTERQSSGVADRRVRHEVRDGFAVMLFSAAASVAFAMLLLLLTRLAVAGN